MDEKARLIIGVLISGLLLAVGCVSEKSLTQNTKYFLPDAPNEWSYLTSPFKQWIELKDVFDDESPVIVIHCEGITGVVGEWATQTLCWARVAGDVAYDSIVIETYDSYGYDSGPQTIEQQYWPVDINNDNLEDIFVLGWGYGEESIYDDGPCRRVAYDEPKWIRLIVRKECKGAPWGIESDTGINWKEVENDPEKYRTYLVEARNVCKDEQWQKRIEQAISLLK